MFQIQPYITLAYTMKPGRQRTLLMKYVKKAMASNKNPYSLGQFFTAASAEEDLGEETQQVLLNVFNNRVKQLSE